LSAKEIYADGVGDERRSSRRFIIILAVSILLLFALTVGALYAIFSSKLRHKPKTQNAALSSSTWMPS
jgi:flagellar basal body-associated protein FliL